MREPKTTEFTSALDHAKWTRDNRLTGLKEISCDEYYGIIKIEYIELF